MTPISLRAFLELYPRKTTSRLRIALITSTMLALLDFGSLLLLLPVFGALTSSGPSGAQLPGGFLDGVSPEVLVVFAMSIMIVRSILGFVVRVWWSKRVASAEVSLSSRMMEAYAYAPYAFHLERNSSILMSRAVAHVNAATAAGLNGIVLLATDATTVVALSAALFIASPVAGAAVFGYLAVMGLVFVLLSRRFTAAQAKRYTAEVSQVYRRTATVLQGIRELTVAGGRESVLRSIQSSRELMVRAQRNMAILSDVPRVTLETALYGAILFALFLVLTSDHPDRTLPLVALYVLAGLRVLPAITRCLGNFTQFRYGVQLGGDIEKELRQVEAIGHQPVERADALPRQDTLRVDQVTFTYGDGNLVLEDVSLTVPFGTFVALVGPSGAGKSTLLGLILGLLKPTAGGVYYGDASIGLADPGWLAHVGYVPQEAFVLDEDIIANVALGDVSPDPERVWRALERAALADVVRAMPDGIQTSMREGGSRLSVGQRQRLGIARALYRDPSVLILDEPTAALDRESEAQVMRTIESLKGSLTIVLVAHRLETIAKADSVYRLDHGSFGRVSQASSGLVADR